MNGRTTRLLGVAITAAATLALGTTAGRATTSAGPYKVVGTFGKSGTANGQFSGARGIAVAPNSDVYIADSNNQRIQIFSRTGAFKGKWGSIGGDTGEFTNPADVAVASDGAVWVADDSNSRAQSFSATGGWKSTLTLPGLESARAIAVNADGDVYIGAEGAGVGGFRIFHRGLNGDNDMLGEGDFSPRDIEVSPDGTVFLATARSDPAEAKVWHFTKDGNRLGSFVLPNASAIGVDLDCNVWAGDFSNRGIAKYSPTGRKLATASYPDLQAQDIAVAKNGDIYVTQLSGPIVHFAENRAKPPAAAIPSRLTVEKGPKVKIMYALRGVSCPAEIGGTATLTGPGISGKVSGLRLATGGKTTAITMPLARGALRNAAASGKATFKIVLQTSGRPTVETRSVTVVVPASAR